MIRRSRASYLGVLAVLGVICVSLYMAFAFPYTMLQLKQTETSEIRVVVVVARGGETFPAQDVYFTADQAFVDNSNINNTNKQSKRLASKLTAAGVERMFALGKFLQLKYYNTLLAGNPTRVWARSSATESCLESAQALVAGLNPPRGSWQWASGGSGTAAELGKIWQPMPVQTTSAEFDDLLAPPASPTNNCPMLDKLVADAKNSSKFAALHSEFKHDLQTLRTNTGLDFEDDLDVLLKIDEVLKLRKAHSDTETPVWYTKTFAARLAHISNTVTGTLLNSIEVQRLFAGRLVHEIAEKLKPKTGGVAAETTRVDKTSEPNIFVYMTDAQRLAALMSALGVYQSLPNFGATLLFELHYDLSDQHYFLRLFTISPSEPQVFPEPVRVNPAPCADSPDVECTLRQFIANVRNLMLDSSAWRESCQLDELTSRPSSTFSLQQQSTISSSITSTTTLNAAAEVSQPATTTTTTESNSVSTSSVNIETTPSMLMEPEGGTYIPPSTTTSIATDDSATSFAVDAKTTTTNTELTLEAASTAANAFYPGPNSH